MNKRGIIDPTHDYYHAYEHQEEHRRFRKAVHLMIVSFVLIAFLYMSFAFVVYYGKMTGNVVNNGEGNSAGGIGAEAANTANIQVDLNSEIGRVRDDFYGANTHGSWLGAGTQIDANGDGVTETASDLAWNRQAWLDSGMKYMRWDASLQNYYSNGTDGSFVFTGNLNNRIDQLKWAHDNGIRVLLIMSYMPTWLANTSVEGCDPMKPQYCPPYDYNIWGDMVVDYLDRLTLNGTYASDVDVEVWNEPDLHQFLLSNQPSHGTQASADAYVKIYNSTYTSIKNLYPTISIVGPSSAQIDIYTNITNSFLSDFADKMGGLSLHNYYPVDGVSVLNRINNALKSCSVYYANCSRIIVSEWNYKNASDTIGTDMSNRIHSEFLAETYGQVLNYYASNVSMMLYQWSETKKYSSDTNYPEYPQKWNMVSEPQLDNEFTPAYNVTKDFTHYHSAGDMIVGSSSDDSDIKVVASTKDNGDVYITLINSGASDTNAIVDLSGTGIEDLRDLQSGVVYGSALNDSRVNVGVLHQYDVKHYESASASDGDTTAPSISISSPTAKKYTTNNVNVNISLNEQGTCAYSLNSGDSKVMSNNGNMIFSGRETGLANGNYTLVAYCFDLSGNEATQSVVFSVNVTSSSSVLPNGPDTSGNAGSSGGGGADTGDVSLNNEGASGAIDNGGNIGQNGLEGNSSGNESKNTLSGGSLLGRAISDISSISGISLTSIIIGLIAGIFVILIIIFVYRMASRRAAKEGIYLGLVNWVTRAKKEGHPEHFIIKTLVDHGCDKELVLKAVREVGEKMASE